MRGLRLLLVVGAALGLAGCGGPLSSREPVEFKNSPGCEKAFAHFLEVHKKYSQWMIATIEKNAKQKEDLIPKEEKEIRAKQKEDLIKGVHAQWAGMKDYEATFMWTCNPSVNNRITEAGSAKFVACILAVDPAQAAVAVETMGECSPR